MANDTEEAIGRVAYAAGLFTGVFSRVDVMAEMKARGVTDDEIEALKNYLGTIISKVIYR